MTFPEHSYSDAARYCDDYFERVARALASVDRALIRKAAGVLRAAYGSGATVFVCGNGGSSSIADHLACDHLKGVQTDTALRPRVTSLGANVALLTAVANDLGFEDVFVYPLRTLARRGDVLVTVSASGDSENVVRAVAWARQSGVSSIALTGFSGGRSGALAETHLHVAADNYGVVEDVHQSIMHVLAQHLRQEHMTPELVAERRF
jgi:D-sedoheptulose 7-phosphate isomerase